MTKAAMIKKHLLSGRKLSGLQALRLYGVYRLSSVINRLKKSIKIEKKMKNGYAQYFHSL